MYQALYRKWRPQTFDEVIGQKHVTDTLRNQIKSARLSHAYIFIGTRGTGKTTCARILAKAVNCENPQDGNPCGVCAACRGIADGTIMDIVELDAASNNGVDSVRTLRDEAVFSPSVVRKRVYIIDEVHMLSTSAFNALLKILEEPPEHLMFILATTELRKVPATILSRCQRHNFKRIDAPDIAAYLLHVAESEHVRLTSDAADLIARLAEGGVRDALSLLDQCSAFEKIDREAVYSAMGLAGTQKTVNMLQYILQHDVDSAITEFAQMWVDGKDPTSVLDELKSLMRDVLMLHVAPLAAPKLLSGACEKNTLQQFAVQMTTEELLGALQTIQNAQETMKGAKTPKTAAEICIVSLCDNLLGDSIAGLRARVSRLEAQLNDPSFADRMVFSASVSSEQTAIPMAVKREADHQTKAEMKRVPASAAETTTREICEKSVAKMVEETLPEEDSYKDSDAEEESLAKEYREQSAGTASDTSVSSGNTEPDAERLKRICSTILEVLPRHLQLSFNNGERTSLALQDNILTIYAEAPFTFKQYEAQRDMISKAIHNKLGINIAVKIDELQAKPQKVHSLEELGAFPEVSFINN